MSYTNYGVNYDTNNLLFINQSNQKKYEINYQTYNDYRKVNKRHYYNSKLNEVILVNNQNEAITNGWRVFVPQTLPKEIVVEYEKYVQCSQCEFDKWHTKTYHDSHNAKIYNILKIELELEL